MTLYPNRVGLVMGVPYSGRLINMEWAFAWHSLHPPMDYNVEISVVKGKPVDVARQQIAEYAVAKGAKYVFFVDEDVTPEAHAMRQLIYHLEHWPDYAIAGGIYCHKSVPQMPMVFRGNGQGPYWDWKVGEVFECSGLGMGCTLIRVEALLQIEKPWFKTIDSIEAFMEGVNQGEQWTEDLYLCEKLAQKGWKIMADGGLRPDHWDYTTGMKYNLPPTAKPLRRMEVTGGKKIIDLGCGPEDVSYTTDEGQVLRVDCREDVKPDFRCDIRKMPFGTAEFDIVFSSHVLEHFARTEVPAVLDEWIRILKPEGELRLVLPNLKWAAQHVMNDEIDNDVMNVFYGAQSYNENFHKCGFVPQTIEQLLAERGFKKFVWEHHNYHMFVRAWKIEPEEVKPANPIVRENQLVAGADCVGDGVTDDTASVQEVIDGTRKAVDSFLKEGVDTEAFEIVDPAKGLIKEKHGDVTVTYVAGDSDRPAAKRKPRKLSILSEKKLKKGLKRITTVNRSKGPVKKRQ